jgi:hypothetical protein
VKVTRVDSDADRKECDFRRIDVEADEQGSRLRPPFAGAHRYIRPAVWRRIADKKARSSSLTGSSTSKYAKSSASMGEGSPNPGAFALAD